MTEQTTEHQIEKIDFSEEPQVEIDTLAPKRIKKLPIKKLNAEIIRKTFEESEGKATKIKINSTIAGEAEFTYNSTVNWGEFNLNEIIDKMVLFSEKLNGLPLHPYQIEPQRRIFESVLKNDGEEITILISRQAGKSECLAQTCNTLLVLLPILAEVYPKQLGQFKRGIRIGLFAPVSEQALVTHRRMDMRLSGEHAEMILSDPDLGAQKKYSGGMIQIWGPMEVFPNGKSAPAYHSYCKVQSAAKQSKIESATFDVILLDEAQDIDTMKVDKSISPMLASTNGTMIKIGTATSYISHYYNAIQRNKRKELTTRIKNHFEYDYKVVQRYNPKYKAYIQREKERMGEHSDAFRMSYALEWLLEKGMAMTPQMFDEYLKAPSEKFEYTPQEGFTYVGGLDLAKETDSTVLTIARLEPEVFVDEDGDQDEKYIKTVVNWLELSGDNWEVQFETVQSMVRNYGLKILAIDSTGVGDPIIDRLERALDDIDCTIVPVMFNLKSKHEMTTIFYEEMRAHRIKIPCHQSAKKTRRWLNFQNQFFSCEKIYKGSYVQLKHPDEKDAHDDYVDSLLLMCYGVSQQVFPRVAETNKRRDLFSARSAGKKIHSQRYEEAMDRMKRAYAGKWRRYIT